MSTRKPQNLRLARNIAKNLVLKRVKDGLNQTKVAEALNVTFQQEQKFEGGNNCLRADQLFLICRKFGWDIRDFDFTNSFMKKIHKAFDRIDNRSRISIAEENKDDIHTS